MEVIKNKIGEQELTVVIKVNEADYAEKVSKEISKLAKTVSIKGFRPGHVPKSMIEKLYGKSIVAQVVTDLVEEKLEEIVKEDNLELIIKRPLASEREQTIFDIENSKNFQFAFDLAYFLPLEIDLSTFEVPYYKIIVEDAQIDELLQQFRKNLGYSKEVENPAEATKIKISLKDAENKVSADNKDVYFDDLSENYKEIILKSTKGDKLTVKIRELFKSEDILKRVLGDYSANELSEDFELTIEEFSKWELAELNQEFFDKAFGKDKVTNEQEAREEIRKMYEQRYSETSEIRFSKDIEKILKNKIEVPIPESYLLRLIEKKNEMSQKEIDKTVEAFKEYLKWVKISNVLVKQMNIKVEYEDVLNKKKEEISNIMQAYGYNTDMFPEEMLKNFASEELNKMKDEEKGHYFNHVQDSKIIEACKNYVKKVVKEVSVDEMKEIFKKEEETNENTEELVEK